MTIRERMMAAYRGEPFDRVPWHGNMDHWYNVNKARGTLPREYADAPLWDIQRDLKVGIWQRVGVVKTVSDAKVRTRREQRDETTITTYETPLGSVYSRHETASDFTRAQYQKEWIVKSPQDLRVALYMLEGEHYEPGDWDNFRQVDRDVGDDGITLSSACADPLMRFISGWMGVAAFSYALADYPDPLDRAIHVSIRKSLEQVKVAAQSPCDIFQIGGNIDAQVVGPELFARYALPFMQEATRLLQDHGRLAQYHFDGAVKPLLPLINETGLDCTESITPLPQGDVTLQHARESLQDSILIHGGIGSALVTHGFSDAEFDAAVIAAARLGARTGRIALGLADNAPPDADPSRIARINEIVEEYGWVS
ncbi:MAG: uroporphyrinogen decarboxylase family protein [Armatimonadota bacterium]